MQVNNVANSEPVQGVDGGQEESVSVSAHL